MRRVFLFVLGLVVLLASLAVMVVAVLTALAEAECGNGTPTTTVTAPGQSVQTMGEMVRYLETQSIPEVDGAGIVGNLMQESTLDPTDPGYGLAQWKPRWWASASAWISAHGQDPNSAGGQLMYIAANVNDNVDGGQFYPGLRADLSQATSPQEAALVWMNDYEQCNGAGPRGSISFTPDSQCEAERRESYAAQALQAAGGPQGGGALLTSLTSGGSCNASFPLTGSIKGYTNPFEKATGLVWERTDQGVDAAMTAGSPLLAFAPSKVMMIAPFYAGQPAIVFEITAGPLAGRWWYWSRRSSRRSVRGRRSTPARWSRRTRPPELGSRSAGGRRTADIRSPGRRPATPRATRHPPEQTSATSCRRSAPIPAPALACRPARRWATAITRDTSEGGHAMRRYLVVALPILLLGAALYVIGSAGSPGHAKSTPQLLPRRSKRRRRGRRRPPSLTRRRSCTRRR